MSVLSDTEILERCAKGMIEPYVSQPVREVNGNKVVSYGVSAYGYDIRVANEFMLVDTSDLSALDPKSDSTDRLQLLDVKVKSILIQANSVVLCRSLEYFRIPRDIICTATGKSTYARCGIIANITPLEPEWEGYLTISLSNTSPLPVRLYVNEGICQLLFFKVDKLCATSYKDKGGKYQNQQVIQASIV